MQGILSAWSDFFVGPLGKVPWALALLLLGALPVALMAPLVGPPTILEMPAAGRARSLRGSVVAASFLAALITVGLLACLVDLWHLATTGDQSAPSPGTGGSSPGMSAPSYGPFVLVEAWLAAWMILGVLWSWALWSAGRQRHPTRLVRVVRLLMAGSMAEVALAVGTIIWIRKRDSCTCSWASFWSIVTGLTTLMLLCGPALALLLTRRSRLQWARFACSQCGYPRRTDSPVCSECGAAFASATAPQ